MFSKESKNVSDSNRLSPEQLQPIGPGTSNAWTRTVLVLPKKVRLKYNTPVCSSVSLTDQGASELQKKYHEINGLPGFVHRFLHGRPSLERALFMLAPEMYKIFDAPDEKSKTILMTNPEYLESEKFISDYQQKSKEYALKQIKKSPNGLALVTWYIHPEALPKVLHGNRSESILAERHKNLAQEAKLCCQDDNLFKYYRYGPDMKPLQLHGSFSRLPRTNSQERINVMEKRSKCPYLASLFDLDIDKPRSLQYLTSLRENILRELEMVYGVTSSDKIKIYLHMPYLDKTTTLHVHIRVNQSDHELENSKSFGLNEIIEQLEKGLSVKDLILEREKIFCSEYPFGEGVDGVTVETKPNPFRDFEDIFSLLEVNLYLIAYLKESIKNFEIKDKMQLIDFEEISKLANKLSELPKLPTISELEIMLDELKINENLRSCGYGKMQMNMNG